MALPTPILLINEEYIKNYTWLNSSVDATLIKPAIMLAQDIHLQQLLGTDLYNAILDGIRNNNLTDDLRTLLDNYIMNPVCWWSMYELIPHLYIKMDNGALAVRTSTDTQTISTSDMEGYKQQALQKATFYGNRLIDYLFKHSGTYAQYTSNLENQLWSNYRSNTSTVVEIGQARPDHSARWKFMVGAKRY